MSSILWVRPFSVHRWKCWWLLFHECKCACCYFMNWSILVAHMVHCCLEPSPNHLEIKLARRYVCNNFLWFLILYVIYNIIITFYPLLLIYTQLAAGDQQGVLYLWNLPSLVGSDQNPSTVKMEDPCVRNPIQCLQMEASVSQIVACQDSYVILLSGSFDLFEHLHQVLFCSRLYI